jgi:hypothetical protein
MKRKKKGKKMLEMKCDVDVDVAFGVEGWWRKKEGRVFC